MKIRTQLITLVAGVMAPLVLLMALVTYSLWHQQRQAYEQRYLERVSALRLALDTELDGIVGSLASAIAPTEFGTSDLEPALQRRFGRLLASHSDWSAAVLVDPLGRELVSQRRADIPATVLLGRPQLAEVIRTRAPLVTGLAKVDAARFMTYIAVPVLQGDNVLGVVYAAVEHAHWLRFLNTYPISARATLTLNDPQGKIIARTLNDDRWVGQRSTSSYLDRTVGKSEGVFSSTGLEGQVFYSAFSRSRRAGWLLGTGVPRQEVEAALFSQTLLISVGTALALVGALVAAWLLGRHISTSLTSLETSASSWPRSADQNDAVLPIREAENVRLALMGSSHRMRSHKDSLTASLQREAAAREAAESGSRSKDAFLAMLGHELRNPLSAITTATAVLSSPDTTPEAAARTRDILSRQTGHLRKMLGDLIDTAELTKGHATLKKSRLDLAELVARVVARFVDTGKCAHVQVRQELRATLVDADSQRLEQVVANLLENACKYTPAGGTVSIRVREKGGAAVLEVSDTGIGIEHGMLIQVFDLFAQGSRTIERAQGGLGIGLSTVKSLVELHQGSVEVRSEGEGRGATFAITLPGGRDASATAASNASRSRQLLTIVEDLPDSREVMAMLLETTDRQINVGEDGPSGVAAILQGPSDVAIVDIGLPVFDGHEVARRVRQAPHGERVLLIALTGYGTAEDRSKALAAGFDAFLVKPFDPDAFESTLATGLAAKARSGSSP